MAKDAAGCEAKSGIVTVRLEIDAMRYEISRALLQREGEIQALAKQGINDVVQQIRPRIAAMALGIAVEELRTYVTNAVRDMLCGPLDGPDDESMVEHIRLAARKMLKKALEAMTEEEK